METWKMFWKCFFVFKEVTVAVTAEVTGGDWK
jgi:hypothetical protein